MPKGVSGRSVFHERISRREFLQKSAAFAALAPLPVLHGMGKFGDSLEIEWGPARRVLTLSDQWLFGGKLNSAALQTDFDDSGFSFVCLPHTVTTLSWQNWNPAAWEDLWCYRRHFEIPPAFRGLRLFLHFDRVMAGARVFINGRALPEHRGGFLPFSYEITELVREGGNVLSIAVDARWINAPPSGSAKGPSSVDYMLPGGITGAVRITAVPAIFIREIFAKPVRILEKDRHLEVLCAIEDKRSEASPIRLDVKLQRGTQVIAQTSWHGLLQQSNQEVRITLEHLGAVALWEIDHPALYEVSVALSVGGQPLHDCRARIGLREATFTEDGFFLNGRRLQLFGLNRHELYPYVGFSASRRALRKDAELLRKEFNCNVVRCSHYPQSEAFLDACDELGLLVWEEIPGWQYIGDEQWQSLALRDVEAMVRRDRNHPSVVIWGVRVNESANDPELYKRTRALAKSLDDSRPTSGSMTPSSRKSWKDAWHQDVFAFDDYHADSDGSVGIDAPLPAVPYMLAEAVGQFDYTGGSGFTQKYRRAGDPATQMRQALLHAEAHNKAASYPRCCGVIAWCAFDYASLLNAYDGLKCPGIADTFRIPKLGAAFYRSQISPDVKPVIEPSFYWDFGPPTPSGPGNHVAIFSNCDRLELSMGGMQYAKLLPDRTGFLQLRYPPFFADLHVDGSKNPELRIDGFVNGQLVVSRSFSSDSTSDKLWLHTDDQVLLADGEDSARIVFGVVDKFGNPRLHGGGSVHLSLAGPGSIVGDNPFISRQAAVLVPYGFAPSQVDGEPFESKQCTPLLEPVP